MRYFINFRQFLMILNIFFFLYNIIIIIFIDFLRNFKFLIRLKALIIFEKLRFLLIFLFYSIFFTIFLILIFLDFCSIIPIIITQQHITWK